MCLWRKMTKMMFALQCCDEVEFESCLILYPGQPCISGRSLELEAPWNCWERCCWARRLNYSRLYWPFLFHHYKPDKTRVMPASLSLNLPGYCHQSLKERGSSNMFFSSSKSWHCQIRNITRDGGGTAIYRFVF